MATENRGMTVSREAGGAITKKRFVIEAGDNKVTQTSASNVMIHGVAVHTVAVGDEAAIVINGDVIVEAGAAVGDNIEVMSDASGRAIVAVTAGNVVVGVTVNDSSSSASGQDLTVRLYPRGQRIL